MKIRTETHEDTKQIHSITYQAFENHPHHEPGAKPTEHLIVDGLRRDNALTVSLVCEANNEVIGHIAFSPILIDGEASTWVGLGPVSVIPEHQRQRHRRSADSRRGDSNQTIRLSRHCATWRSRLLRTFWFRVSSKPNVCWSPCRILLGERI